MKIISGKYRGRLLEGFNLDGTRPTMDRVKESLFGMIQGYVVDSVVLDLFSGSGALGIEAISEGAKYSYLVDSNSLAIKTIKKNIINIGIDNVEVIKNDYKEVLKDFYNKNIKLDLIFLDPPYKTNYIEKSIELISKYDLLTDSGLIVCESDSLDKIIYPNNYIVSKDRKYGDKYIVILKKV